MACGKTVFFLLVIAASTSCAPAEQDSSSSKEENGPPKLQPPPYHQSPFHDSQNSHGQQDSREQHDKDETHGQDAYAALPNIGSSREENLEIPPYHQSPFNYSVGHFDSQDHHDRAGLFDQFFQEPLQQLINTFGMFIPGLGGSNSTGLPNLFSAFMPHFGRSQRIELPDDFVGQNETEDLSPHDRFFFSLFQHFFHNSANSNIAIGCNYTTQAGYSCSGCREQLICSPNNVGRIRICPRNSPYCYNGVCGSLVNTTACTSTTTATG